MFSRQGNSKVYMYHNHLSSNFLLTCLRLQHRTPWVPLPAGLSASHAKFSWNLHCWCVVFYVQANSMTSGVLTACLLYRNAVEEICPCALWIKLWAISICLQFNTMISFPQKQPYRCHVETNTTAHPISRWMWKSVSDRLKKFDSLLLFT